MFDQSSDRYGSDARLGDDEQSTKGESGKTTMTSDLHSGRSSRSITDPPMRSHGRRFQNLFRPFTVQRKPLLPVCAWMQGVNLFQLAASSLFFNASSALRQTIEVAETRIKVSMDATQGLNIESPRSYSAVVLVSTPHSLSPLLIPSDPLKNALPVPNPALNALFELSSLSIRRRRSVSRISQMRYSGRIILDSLTPGCSFEPHARGVLTKGYLAD